MSNRNGSISPAGCSSTSLSYPLGTLFIAEFPGHFLGGTAVVWAENQEEARSKVVNEMRENGLTYRIGGHISVRVASPSPEGVLYFDNGDY